VSIPRRVRPHLIAFLYPDFDRRLAWRQTVKKRGEGNYREKKDEESGSVFVNLIGENFPRNGKAEEQQVLTNDTANLFQTPFSLEKSLVMVFTGKTIVKKN